MADWFAQNAPKDTGDWFSKNAPSAQATLPGTEKTGMPGVPKPQMNIPDEEDAGTSGVGGGIPMGHMVQQGTRQVRDAAASFANHHKMEGGANLIEGAGKMAAPLAIPAAIGAPIATGAAMGAGYLGGKGGEAASRHFGGGEDAQRLSGDLASIPASMAGGMAGGVASSMARPLFQRGMGIKTSDLTHGADPVSFGLNNTSSVRPGQVSKEAADVIRGKVGERDALIKGSNTPIDLTPARNLVNGAIQNRQGHLNDLSPDVSGIAPIASHLTQPATGFAGNRTITPAGTTEIAPSQNPWDFLGLKQGLDRFTNYNMTDAQRPPSVGIANQAQHTMADQLHQAIPGTGPLDADIHSGIPLVPRGQRAALQGGPMENVLDRMTARTGSMVAPLAAAHFGGVIPAAGMMAAQAALENPTVKLIGARALHAAGQPLPPGQAAPLGPLIRRKDQ